MKVIERVIEYRGRSTELHLYPVADVHLGARACNEAALDETLDAIDRDANALWLGLGDYCDYINLRDPRFSIESLPRWLYDAQYEQPKVGIAALQRDELARRINKRKSLSKKLLCMVEGNHEAMVRKYCEIDSYMGLAEQIRADKTPVCLGASGFLVLRFRRITGKDEEPSLGSTYTLVIYLHHGFGGGDLAGGVALKLERIMDRYDADVCLMGHHHKVLTHTATRPITLDGNLQMVQPPDRQGAICGTFLRSVIADADTYSETKGYRPSPGSTSVVIRVRPDKREYELCETNSGRETAL